MRYRTNRIQMPKTAHKSPSDMFANDPYIDDSMKMVVALWMLAGWSKKEAWSAIYHPKCKPNSIPPQVSNFFAMKEVKEIVTLWRSYYFEHPYLNSKCWP